MNANELADKLDEAADDLESEKIFAWEERAAATMLRQQQVEIVKLKLEWQYMATKLEEYNLLYGTR